MERKQFTFYASFYNALGRIKKQVDRATAYDIICEYALFGKEPDLDALPDAVAIAFELIRPNLDASKKKAEAGKLGGKARGGKQPGPEEPQPGGDPELGRVMDCYLNFNPQASPMSLEKLKVYYESVGADLCIKAISIARDERKATWSYIEGILKRFSAQGLRSIEDYEADEKRRSEKNGARGADNEQTGGDAWQRFQPSTGFRGG